LSHLCISSFCTKDLFFYFVFSMLQLDLTQLSKVTTLSSDFDTQGIIYLVDFISRYGLRFYCVQCDATLPRKLPRLSVPTPVLRLS